MNYLLDTCSLLWLALGDAKLSARATTIIGDQSIEGFVSVVSLWEISMKAVTGKLPVPLTPIQIGQMAESNGLNVLALSVGHVDRFHRLPASHRDAFDRLLCAVAIEHSLMILTPDPAFDALGVNRAW